MLTLVLERRLLVSDFGLRLSLCAAAVFRDLRLKSFRRLFLFVAKDDVTGENVPPLKSAALVPHRPKIVAITRQV